MYLYLVVPNAPEVKLIPSYSSDDQALEALFMEMTVNQTVSVCIPCIEYT